MTKEPKTEHSVTLYYKSDGSDKVYTASLEPSGDLFVVNFAYGRRGSTMTTGTKTQSPVPYEAAKKIYDKAVKEKTAKGYTEGESGALYAHTDKEARKTGFVPQLLNPVDESESEALIKDDGYAMQEKFDGKRIETLKDENGVVGMNRLGLTCGIPQCVADELASIKGSFLMDGEMVGEHYYVFDMRQRNGVNIEAEPYTERLSQLASIFDFLQFKHMTMAGTARTETSKRRMLAVIREKNREGVVFKRLDAPYVPGRPNSRGNQLKLKFVETASCIVTQVNDKRSVALHVMEGKKAVGVGNCTVPPNYDLPKAGDVVEIRYLYAYKGGSLYQPVYLGVRDDIPATDCKITQLKYKNTPDEN